MRDSDMQDAIFRESVRQLERGSVTQGRGIRNPQFIIERKAVGATQWQPFSAHFSLKRAQQALPDNTENYEYRIRNGSHKAQ